MTTKITADNIQANSITVAQISLSSLTDLYTAGNGINIEANGTISTSFATVDQENITIQGALKVNTPFFLNSTTVDYDYTVPANINAMSAGPLTIADGVTVAVSSGARWVII